MFGSLQEESQDRLERARRAIDEFNAGTMGSAFDAFFVADVRFRDELGELDNRADLRAYLESFQEAFGGLHVEVERAREIGDTLLLVVNQGGRGKMSGAEVEERFTWLLTFQGEGCVRWQIYAEHADALEALGVAGRRDTGPAMPQENVDVTREVVDAMNRRDTDAFIGLLRPDVEWEENSDLLPGLRQIYRGRAEVRGWFEEAFLEIWESFHLEIKETTEASNALLLVETFVTARGGASGAETELHTWNLVWFADGKVARRQVFRTRDEALEAAGLRE